MSRIEFVEYDPQQHRNPMQWFDDTQRERHLRAPKLIPYTVCLVSVKRFTFIFHSVAQIRLCIDYYQQKIHPSSRLPVQSGDFGGDHCETQRWFERLPQFLLENQTRLDVVKALKKALIEYSVFPGAETGVKLKPYDQTW